MTDQENIFSSSEGDAWFFRNQGVMASADSIEMQAPRLLMEQYGLNPIRILEIGCSNGWRLNEIRERYSSICLGVEPSQAAIDEGRRLFPEITLLKGVASSVPIQEPCDLVIVNYVMHWVSREALYRSINEIVRLVADGEYLILGDFDPDVSFRNSYKHLPDQGVYTYKWLYFRDVFEEKDQTIGFKAVCNHVEGRLVKEDELEKEGLLKSTNVNCIVYDNAFMDGIDLIVYFERSTMRKCVRIRKKEVKDYLFDFELSLPKDATLSRMNNEISFPVDLATAKDFETDGMTVIETEKGKTFLCPFLMWDDTKEIIAKVSYFVDEKGRQFLRKHIPATFMEKSVGDVFTDTTTTYYPSNDYSLGAEKTTWALAHDALISNAYYNSAGNGYLAASQVGATDWRIYRLFINFNTSGLTASAVISAASANLKGNTKAGTQTAHSYNVYDSTAQDTIAIEDYDLCGTTAYCDTPITQLDWNAAGYNVHNFNAAGIAAISKTGTTKIVYRETTKDVANSAPTTTNYTYTINNNFATAGTSSDPYLSITYTPPETNTSIKQSPSGGAAYGGVSMY